MRHNYVTDDESRFLYSLDFEQIDEEYMSFKCNLRLVAVWDYIDLNSDSAEMGWIGASGYDDIKEKESFYVFIMTESLGDALAQNGYVLQDMGASLTLYDPNDPTNFETIRQY